MKRHRLHPSASWRTCCAALGLLLALAGLAHADVKLTCSVKTTPGGVPPGVVTSPPRAVTVFYKGKAARSEAEGGPIAIYEGAMGRVYSLTPGQTTYRAYDLSDLLSRPDVVQSPALNGMTFDVTVRLDKSAATKTIAGRQVQRYFVAAAMRPKQVTRRGGQRVPPGVYPGPGATSGPGVSVKGGGPLGDILSRSGVLASPRTTTTTTQIPPGVPGEPGSLQMSGEYWLADAAFLPAGAESPLVPLLRQTTTLGPVLKELSAQLAKLKLFPLAGSVTVTGLQRLATMTLDTQTISEGPLDAALFQVPGSYKQIPDLAR